MWEQTCVRTSLNQEALFAEVRALLVVLGFLVEPVLGRCKCLQLIAKYVRGSESNCQQDSREM
jgi:hypothetical protein